MIRVATAAILLAVASNSTSAVRLTADAPYVHLVTRDAYLMGTRARLATYAATRESGLTRLETALAVLEDTERELSTWRADSQISQLNRQPIGIPWTAAPSLCRTFATIFDWHRQTDGAFDPAIGRVLDAWDVHGRGAVPDAAALARARASSGLRLLAFDPAACALTRTSDVTVDAGAFGKGEALDRVAAALGSSPWMIDLGGQISVGGDAPPPDAWRVDLAHPRHRDRAYLQLRLTGGSLSTSGSSERDLVVSGIRVGHIIDPRTGRPAAYTGSVTVWQPNGLAADILSTALYVMGPDAGLRWAEERGLAACYLDEDGGRVRMRATRAFAPLIAPE